MANAKRKLAAILSADVVGYSRLMADDETATVTTLQEYRAAGSWQNQKDVACDRAV